MSDFYFPPMGEPHGGEVDFPSPPWANPMGGKLTWRISLPPHGGGEGFWKILDFPPMGPNLGGHFLKTLPPHPWGGSASLDHVKKAPPLIDCQSELRGLSYVINRGFNSAAGEKFWGIFGP